MNPIRTIHFNDCRGSFAAAIQRACELGFIANINGGPDVHLLNVCSDTPEGEVLTYQPCNEGATEQRIALDDIQTLNF